MTKWGETRNGVRGWPVMARRFGKLTRITPLLGLASPESLLSGPEARRSPRTKVFLRDCYNLWRLLFVDASRQQLQFPTLTGTISKVFEISIRRAIIQQNGDIWVRQARKPPSSSLGDTWPVATLLGISGSARSLSAFAVFPSSRGMQRI